MTKSTQKISMRWVVYTALALCAFLLGLAAFYLNLPPSGKTSPPRAVKPPLADMRLYEEPRFLPSLSALLFRDENGREQSLADYSGQVVIVNFWASWCAPCREEMPSLNALQHYYRHAPVRVLAVSLDGGAPSQPLAFLERLGVDGLVFLHDPKQKSASALGIFGLPTTLVLNQKGEEVARLIGDTKWDSAPAFELIDGLLAAHKPSPHRPAASNALSNSGMAVNKSATKP